MIQFIRRGYGTTCTVCGATVLNLDRTRHRAWHNKIARQLETAGGSNELRPHGPEEVREGATRDGRVGG